MDADQAERERWEGPLDLAALGELAARWLEGSGWNPCYGDPDDETTPLVPHLAAMNRSGYVTDFSQPGALGDGWAQRAAVTGYCDHAQAECLASLSLGSDLIVIAHYPGGEATYELPITQDGGRTFTILPGHTSGEVQELWDGFHEQTVALLSECHYVAVCDPQWGRDDLLWPSVAAALERDARECAGSLIDPDQFADPS